MFVIKAQVSVIWTDSYKSNALDGYDAQEYIFTHLLVQYGIAHVHIKVQTCP